MSRSLKNEPIQGYSLPSGVDPIILRTAGNIDRIAQQPSELKTFVESLNNELCGLLLRTIQDATQARSLSAAPTFNDASALVAQNIDAHAQAGQLNVLVGMLSMTAKEALKQAIVQKAQEDANFQSNVAFQSHLNDRRNSVSNYTTTEAVLDFFFMPTYYGGSYGHRYSGCGHYNSYDHYGHDYYNHGFYGPSLAQTLTDSVFGNPHHHNGGNVTQQVIVTGNNNTVTVVGGASNSHEPTLLGGVANLANGAVERVETVATGTLHLGEDAAATAGNAASAVVENTSGFFETVFSTVSGAATTIVDVAGNAASAAGNAASFFATTAASAASAAVNLAGNAASAAGDAASAASDCCDGCDCSCICDCLGAVLGK
jgi:hypothetical protein